MIELTLAALLFAALLWQHRRQLREAERRGYVAGQYDATQLAAQRERRKL